MGLDLLPPVSAMLAAFGSQYPGKHTGRGRGPFTIEAAWLPSRIEQLAISDSAVTDLMPVLAIPLAQVGGYVQEGDRTEIPPKGSSVPHIYTVRRVYDHDDGGFAICGMAA